jgi:hypothetical protein
MRDNGHSENQGFDSIARWYVASLTPTAHSLKQHLEERRSIAEVLARRRFIELALVSPRRPGIADHSPGTSLRAPRSRALIAHDMRARAARYRELAESLLDPTVISVVETCALELETEIPTLESNTPAE